MRAPSWWEGFYATFFADLVRAGLVVAVALGLVHLWVRTARRHHAGPVTDAPSPAGAAGPR